MELGRDIGDFELHVCGEYVLGNDDILESL